MVSERTNLEHLTTLICDVYKTLYETRGLTFISFFVVFNPLSAINETAHLKVERDLSCCLSTMELTNKRRRVFENI